MAVAKKTRLPGTTGPRTTDPAPEFSSKRAVVAFGVIAAAIAVTIALVVGSHHSSSPAATVKPILPTLFTASGLQTLAAGLNQPVYWIGPVPGDRYEVTRTTANAVYVRYLPLGVDAGTRQGKYLLIATYPLYQALASLKTSDNGHPLRVAGAKGAIAVVEGGKPTNVRVAFPNVDYEVELYDPSPKKARKLARSGALTPVP